MILYKYTDAKWVKPMLRRGQIRIGTLYEYRAAEDLGERHDADEGTSVERHHMKFATSESMNHFERRFFPRGSDSVFVNNDLTLHTSSPNCFVYCMSTELSAAAAGKYTACVEIANANEFLSAVSDVLVETVGKTLDRLSGKVRYDGREFVYPAPGYVPVGFLKPRRLEFEREYRAIWIAQPPTAESKTICVRDLPRGLLREAEIPRS